MGEIQEAVKNLNGSDLNKLKQAFNLFDIDGTGSISAEELAEALRLLGFNAEIPDMVAIIEEVDMDGNGKIEFDEFVYMMLPWLDSDITQEDINKMFTIFDKDGDGYIRSAELKIVFNQLGENLTDDEIDDIICNADYDEDGAIGKDDFKRIMLNIDSE